jgi:hypothetical protein
MIGNRKVEKWNSEKRLLAMGCAANLPIFHFPFSNFRQKEKAVFTDMLRSVRDVSRRTALGKSGNTQ